MEKKLTKAEMQFQINQLRTDKMIYALESVAVSMVSLILFGGLQFIVFQFPKIQNYVTQIATASIAIPILFWIFTVTQALLKLRKIRELEKELYK